MDLRARIGAALAAAEAEGDARGSATLRLVMATIRDREHARRTAHEDTGIAADTAEIRDILSRLAAQRRASAEAFELAGRLEQAAEKTAEAESIEAFLPRRMSDAEVDALIARTVEALGATTLRDIGHVMAALRPQLAEQIDPAELKVRVRHPLDPPA